MYLRQEEKALKKLNDNLLMVLPHGFVLLFIFVTIYNIL
jgi:hypothetical protein